MLVADSRSVVVLSSNACVRAWQSRLLVQDCAAKLETMGLQGAIQEVSMIKVRVELELLLSCRTHVVWVVDGNIFGTQAVWSYVCY